MASTRLSCSACHHVLPDNARFCVMCGVAVSTMRTCPACDAETPSYGRFCAQCGVDFKALSLQHDPLQSPEAKVASQIDLQSRSQLRDEQSGLMPALEEPPVALEAQKETSDKRLVSVLFADVSGFTAMSEKLDSEVVTDIMNGVFDKLTEIIVKNGGYIDKYIGDCIMARFGAPVSYGDDAQRAVRAALAMQASLQSQAEELTERAGTLLQMRIGINTGMVTAGYVGRAGHGAYTVMGDTVNTANRLESACVKGRILISASTCRFAAGRFWLEDAGSFEVKGKSDAVHASYVLRERERSLHDMEDFFEGVAIPLVGRNAELGELQRHWDGVVKSSSLSVGVVSGPSGIGKSRLMADFLKSLDSNATTIVYARQAESTAMQPMMGLRVALSRHLIEEWGSHQAALTVLSQSFSDTADAVSEDFRATSEAILLTFLKGENPFQHTTPRAKSDSMRALCQALFWGLARLMRALAARQPTAMFIANAHLADEILVDFVEYLLESHHDGSPTLILLEEAHGFEELELTFGQVLTKDAVFHLPLEPIEPNDVADLADTLLKNCGFVPPWVREWLVPRAEGVPFYAIEHLRALESLGVLRIDNDDGTWHIDDAPPIGQALPETLHAAMQATIDARPPIQRELLQRAAVVGNVFWESVVSELLADLAPADVIKTHLALLAGEGFIDRRAASSIRGIGAEYRFSSELFRQTCYDGLLHKRRRTYHGKIGHALAHVGVAVTNPELVAGHYTNSGELEEANRLYIIAARSQLKAAALGATRDLLTCIDSLVASGGSETGRRVARLKTRVEHRFLVGELARIEGGYEAALAHYDEGFRLMRETPERRIPPTRESLDAIEAELWIGSGVIHQVRGEYRAARDQFDKAANLLMRQKPVPVAALLDVRASLAWVLRELHENEAALAICQEIIEEFSRKDIGDLATALAVARHYDTYATELSSDKEKAEAALYYYEQARQLRIQAGDPMLLSVSESNRAIALVNLGKLQEAADVFKDVLRFRQELGHAEKTAVAHLNLAESLLLLGNNDEARTNLCAGRDIALALGAQPLVDIADKMLVRANASPEEREQQEH